MLFKHYLFLLNRSYAMHINNARPTYAAENGFGDTPLHLGNGRTREHRFAVIEKKLHIIIGALHVNNFGKCNFMNVVPVFYKQGTGCKSLCIFLRFKITDGYFDGGKQIVLGKGLQQIGIRIGFFCPYDGVFVAEGTKKMRGIA